MLTGFLNSFAVTHLVPCYESSVPQPPQSTLLQASVVNANGTAVNQQPAPAGNRINLTMPVRNFRQQVTSWPGRQAGMDVHVKLMKQRDLPGWVFPYNKGKNPCLTPEELQVGGGAGTLNFFLCS